MKALRALAAAGVLSLLAGSACSDWPPESEGGGSGGSNDFPIAEGSCTGTPLPCSSLNAAQCEAVPGCDDNGICSGSGITCGTERSFSSCESAPDCYWSAACSGSPLGCSTTTKASCEAMAGCRWTPRLGTGGSGGGSGGSGGSGTGGAPRCASLGSPCVNASSCDCNLSCVALCGSCQRICAKTCQSDGDCTGTGGLGVATPYCVGQGTASSPKVCGAAR